MRRDRLGAHPEDSGGGSADPLRTWILFTVWPLSRSAFHVICFKLPPDPSPPDHGTQADAQGFCRKDSISRPCDYLLSWIQPRSAIFPAHDLVPDAQLVIPPQSPVSSELAVSSAITSSPEPAPVLLPPLLSRIPSVNLWIGGGRHISSSGLGCLPNHYEQPRRISSYRRCWPCPRSRLCYDLNDWRSWPTSLRGSFPSRFPLTGELLWMKTSSMTSCQASGM